MESNIDGGVGYIAPKMLYKQPYDSYGLSLSISLWNDKEEALPLRIADQKQYFGYQVIPHSHGYAYVSNNGCIDVSYRTVDGARLVDC